MFSYKLMPSTILPSIVAVTSLQIYQLNPECLNQNSYTHDQYEDTVYLVSFGEASLLVRSLKEESQRNRCYTPTLQFTTYNTT